jgi:hypothetical protein
VVGLEVESARVMHRKKMDKCGLTLIRIKLFVVSSSSSCARDCTCTVFSSSGTVKWLGDP